MGAVYPSFCRAGGFGLPLGPFLRPPRRYAPCAGSGRALPCTRNFFEKELSKSFIPAAAGMGAAR
ncbi:hypothetical protein D7X33_09825 [Butyricicoccus sp. 1XD8-22]|nr:hypothetical protein D7X33_09825 [Butyricicoccus sp. 1XD8-22]